MTSPRSSAARAVRPWCGGRPRERFVAENFAGLRLPGRALRTRPPVTAEEVVPVGQDVRERQAAGCRGRGAARRRGRGLDDPARGTPGQDGADGHAQLVDQARRRELAEQVRAALGEDLPVAQAGQRADRGRGGHLVLAADDHVGVPGHVRPAGRGRGLRRDDDGAGPGWCPRQERARRVQVQPAAQHGDGRGGRAPRAQSRPAPRDPGRAVSLRAGGARADQDHPGQRPEQPEHLAVSGAAQAAGQAVHGRGPIGAPDHVGPDPGPVQAGRGHLGPGRIGVEPGQVRRPLGGRAGIDQPHGVSSTPGSAGRTGLAGPAHHDHGAAREHHR